MKDKGRVYTGTYEKLGACTSGWERRAIADGTGCGRQERLEKARSHSKKTVSRQGFSDEKVIPEVLTKGECHRMDGTLHVDAFWEEKSKENQSQKERRWGGNYTRTDRWTVGTGGKANETR